MIKNRLVKVHQTFKQVFDSCALIGKQKTTDGDASVTREGKTRMNMKL